MRQQVMASAAHGYLLLVVLATALLGFPLRHHAPVVILVGLAVTSWATIRHLARRLLPMHSPWYLVLLWLTSAMIFMTGLVFGPLLVVPIVLTGSLAGFLAQPTAVPARTVIAAHALPFVALHSLEAFGALPSTFHVEHGTVVLAPWAIELTPWVVAVNVGVTMAMQFFNTAFIALAGRRAQIEAQDRVHAQAWHLAQLLPVREVPRSRRSRTDR